MYGNGFVYKSKKANAEYGIAQQWIDTVNIARTTRYWSKPFNGFQQLLHHNEETIIVSKRPKWFRR